MKFPGATSYLVRGKYIEQGDDTVVVSMVLTYIHCVWDPTLQAALQRWLAAKFRSIG